MNYVKRQRKVEDMIINFMLTKEEVDTLEKSPICLNCNHREIFHAEEDTTSCLIPNCLCTEVIKEGDYSYWNINSYNSMYNNIIAKPIIDKLAKLISVDKITEYKEFPLSEAKVIRIKRYDRFKL